MVLSIAGFLEENLGKKIFIPGYATAECVAPFWKFNREHKGEVYSANGAANLWTNYTKWDSYTRVTGKCNTGDWVIWSGGYGAYTNGGYGHIAMFLELAEPGYAWFASQNPGEFRRQKLSLFGAVGQLRPIGVPQGSSTAVNRTLSGNAFVRAGAGTVHPLAKGYPTYLDKGQIVSVLGYVQTSSKQYPLWVKTVSGFFIWSGNISGGIKGLAKL